MSKKMTTFIGGSQTLNIVDKHCYAYSGIAVSGSAGAEKTYLLYQTPDKVITGAFDWGYSALNNNENSTMRIYFNNVQVFQIEKEGSELNYNIYTDIVIPPNTEVKVTIESTDTGDSYLAKFTGRIYG
jgi:hypothetical protein